MPICIGNPSPAPAYEFVNAPMLKHPQIVRGILYSKNGIFVIHQLPDIGKIGGVETPDPMFPERVVPNLAASQSAMLQNFGA